MGASACSVCTRVATSLPSLLPTHHNTPHPMSLQVNGIIRAQAAQSEKSEHGCLSLRHCTRMVPKGSSEVVIQGERWSVAYVTRMSRPVPKKEGKNILPKYFLWQNLIEANEARRSRRRTTSGNDWKPPSWWSTNIQGHILYAGVRKSTSSVVELAGRCLHLPSHRLI